MKPEEKKPALNLGEELRHNSMTIKEFLTVFLKWFAAASLAGTIGSLVGSGFALSVDFATKMRNLHPWLLYLLPAAGIAIAAIYKFGRIHKKNTNTVIDSIIKGERVPPMLVPAIFISTVLTHLCGGSAGREGAALQIGGGIGNAVGRGLKLSEKDMRIATLCGMSAVFAALFGTPVTATVFSMEVISIGIIHYSALVPCIWSSLIGASIAHYLGVEKLAFSVAVPALSASMLGKTALCAVVFAAVSIIFCRVMHGAEHLFSKIGNIWLRVFLGGVLVIALTLLFGTRDYNGAGMGLIIQAVEEGRALPWAFALKLLLTAVTIGSGYKGGEIVPTLFVGATLGCALAGLFNMPAGFAAAVGMICLFCGNTNCPLASIILSVEAFGSAGLIFFAPACCISYMLSGYYGLYSSQKIMYSKLSAEYINIHTK